MLVHYSYNKFSIKLEAVGFTEKEEQKIRVAAYYVVRALGDDEFKDFCLNYEYKIKTCYWDGLRRKCYLKPYKGFHATNGLSNLQVYKHLMCGKEVYPRETICDQEADIFLKIDRSNGGNVVGYTRKSTKWQWIYQWVMQEKSIGYIAGNLAHEWIHKCGYSHSKNDPDYKPTRKKHTVTYAVGNYVRDYCKKYLEGS